MYLWFNINPFRIYYFISSPPLLASCITTKKRQVQFIIYMVNNHREKVCFQRQQLTAEHFCPPGSVAVTESVVTEIEDIAGINHLFSLHQWIVSRNPEAHHQ